MFDLVRSWHALAAAAAAAAAAGQSDVSSLAERH
jgi:hypothetical protein